jgi:hypothetical protein
MGMVRKPLMPAAIVFGLSAIACRNFLIYYWPAVAAEPV